MGSHDFFPTPVVYIFKKLIYLVRSFHEIEAIEYMNQELILHRCKTIEQNVYAWYDCWRFSKKNV